MSIIRVWKLNNSTSTELAVWHRPAGLGTMPGVPGGPPCGPWREKKCINPSAHTQCCPLRKGSWSFLELFAQNWIKMLKISMRWCKEERGLMSFNYLVIFCAPTSRCIAPLHFLPDIEQGLTAHISQITVSGRHASKTVINRLTPYAPGDGEEYGI